MTWCLQLFQKTKLRTRVFISRQCQRESCVSSFESSEWGWGWSWGGRDTRRMTHLFSSSCFQEGPPGPPLAWGFILLLSSHCEALILVTQRTGAPNPIGLRALPLAAHPSLNFLTFLSPHLAWEGQRGVVKGEGPGLHLWHCLRQAVPPRVSAKSSETRQGQTCAVCGS